MGIKYLIRQLLQINLLLNIITTFAILLKQKSINLTKRIQMSVKLSRSSSATTDSLNTRTMYMFSCDNCPAHELLGNPIDGCKIYSIPDEKGEFKNYVMKIERVCHVIPKGYFGYSPEKSIFTLSQFEAEENFGQHVCPSRLFFQPHLDPYAEYPPHRKMSSQRQRTASLDESTCQLVKRTGEAADSAFGAPVKKQCVTNDPWGLLKKDSSLKNGKKDKPPTNNPAESETIEILCTKLGHFNLGHLKLSRPHVLRGLLAPLRE